MRSANHNMNAEMSHSRSVALVSAGRLAAGISKSNRSSTQADYQFTITDAVDPITADSTFCLCDLLHLIKLVQLIATEIANDGCAVTGDQAWLRRVATHLDQLLVEMSSFPAASQAARFAESQRNSREPDNGLEAHS